MAVIAFALAFNWPAQASPRLRWASGARESMKLGAVVRSSAPAHHDSDVAVAQAAVLIRRASGWLGQGLPGPSPDASPLQGLDHFTISIPAPVTAGQTVKIRIYAKDSAGSTLVGYSGTPTWSDAEAVGTGSPAPFVAGVSTNTLTFPLPYHGEALTVSDATVSTMSKNFNVLGPLQYFAITLPSPITVATGLSLTVSAKDSAGNTITTYNGTPTWSDLSGLLHGSPAPFSSGTSNNTVTFSAPDRGDKVSVSDGAVTTATRPFNVIGPLQSFAIAVPRPVLVGHAVKVVVTAKDAAGNTLNHYTGAPLVRDTSGLLAGAPAPFSAGASTNMVTFTAPYHSDAIGVSDGAITSTSTRFNVLGPLYDFTVRMSAPVRTGRTASATIYAMDSAGDTVTSYSGTPSWSDRAGILMGSPAPFSLGVSRNSVVFITPYHADGVTIRDGPIASTSADFDIVGPFDHFAITQPPSVQTGRLFMISVRAADSLGDTLSDYSASATWSDTAGQIGGSPQPFVDGVSTNPVTLNTVVTSDAITVNAGGDNATGPSFDVSPPTAPFTPPPGALTDDCGLSATAAVAKPIVVSIPPGPDFTVGAIPASAWRSPWSTDRSWATQFYGFQYLGALARRAWSDGDGQALSTMVEQVAAFHDQDPDPGTSLYGWDEESAQRRLQAEDCLYLVTADSRLVPGMIADARVTFGPRYLGPPYHRVHNHGLMANLRLFDAGWLLGNPAWQQIAMTRITADASQSFSSAGTMFEQATGYEEVYFKLWSQAADDLALVPGSEDTVALLRADTAKAANVLRWFTEPDGNIVQIGDSDLIAGRTAHDEGHLFRDDQTGFVAARWSWTDPRTTYYTIRYGPPLYAHGHNDRGSVTWSTGGDRVLVGVGRFAYGDSGPYHSWQTSPAGANMAVPEPGMFDGAGPVTIASQSLGLDEDVWQIDDEQWARAHTRTIDITDSSHTMVVTDAFTDTGTFSQYWHLSPTWRLVQATGHSVVFDAEDGHVLTVTSTGTVSALLLGSDHPEGGWVFPTINHKTPANEIVLSTSDPTMATSFSVS